MIDVKTFFFLLLFENKRSKKRRIDRNSKKLERGFLYFVHHSLAKHYIPLSFVQQDCNYEIKTRSVHSVIVGF